MSDKVLIVSGDGHAGAPPEVYLEFIEEQYVPDLQALVEVDEAWQRDNVTQSKYSDELLDLMDPGDAIRSGGTSGAWDLDRRIAELDREGVAAELVLPGAQDHLLPFFHVMNAPFPAELRAAGARAYHRHLAGLLTASGGRLAGVADPSPCHDMDATLDELRWVAEHGFVSVQVPGVVSDPTLPMPPLSDPYYASYFAACADLGLVLNAHGGHGMPQSGDMMAKMLAMMGSISAEDKLSMVHGKKSPGVRLDEFPKDDHGFVGLTGARRTLWQLMLGGVFDRHPTLKLVFTEMRADWVPDLLTWLDHRFEHERPGFELAPSEYWARHCYVTPSSPRPYEVAMREQIGVDKFMLGVDFPHPEGTWPNTRDWLQTAFAGVSEPDLRKMLGLNAVECYGLDLDGLTKVAAEIGPTFDQLMNGGGVDELVIDTFHNRSGYSRPPEQFDPEFYSGQLSEDMAAIG